MDKPTSTTSNELVLTRVFSVPCELVYRAWTEPEHFKRWFGPALFTTPYCTIDLRVGGKIHYCMRSPEGRDYWGAGIFTEIVRNERIVADWFFSDKDGARVSPKQHGLPDDLPDTTTLIVTFEESAGKTTLTVHTGLIESAAKQIGADVGWNQSFDKLATDLALQLERAG